MRTHTVVGNAPNGCCAMLPLYQYNSRSVTCFVVQYIFNRQLVFQQQRAATASHIIHLVRSQKNTLTSSKAHG